MKILIFEPNSSGHRFQYVAVMVESFRSISDQIIVATSAGAKNTKEYAVHLAPLRDFYDIDDTFNVRQGSGVYWLQLYLALLRSVRKYRPDHVYIPFGDGLVQILGIGRLIGIRLRKRSSKLSVVLFRGRSPDSGGRLVEKAKTWLWQFATSLAKADGYYFINPYQFESIRRRGFESLSRKSRVIPEPVEPMNMIPKALARSQLGIPEDGKYIGCLGRLDRRKGVDLLIRAFAKADLGERHRLLLLGSASTDICELLQNDFHSLIEKGRIVAIDRYLSQKELVAGLYACDVICTPYPNHQTSSGFVVRAAAAERPILASHVGWMGKVVDAFDLGSVCNVKNIEEFSSKLKLLLENSEEYSPSVKAKLFVKYHTVENCKAHWRMTLEGSKKICTPDVIISWDYISATLRKGEKVEGLLF